MALAIVGLFILLAFGACGLIAKGVSDTQQAQTAERAKTCVGKTYPDQQANDVCADASGAAAIDDVALTATPLKANKEGNLCTTVSYTNNTKDTLNFNEFDWKLQSPKGEVVDGFASGGDLNSGLIIKGASKKGSLCYKNMGKGDYVLIYDPSGWTDVRGVWLNKVS